MLEPHEAQALVKKHGSQRAAARATGIPRSTLRRCLDPEAHRKAQRLNYAANPEPKRARDRQHYHTLTGLDYAHRLLQLRRWKALQRMKGRSESGEIQE